MAARLVTVMYPVKYSKPPFPAVITEAEMGSLTRVGVLFWPCARGWPCAHSRVCWDGHAKGKDTLQESLLPSDM